MTVTMPGDPTPEMVRAAQEEYSWLSDRAIIEIYNAMVNARPGQEGR